MSTATATATPTAPARPTREYAEEFLASVTPWIFKLAGRYRRRLRMPIEDLAADIMANVFEHLHQYDAGRGSRTNWVKWRAKSVVLHIRSRRRLRRKVHAVPFSVLASGLGDRFEGDAAEVFTLARQGPEAEAGQMERAEDLAEIRAGVRQAVGWLPPARKADITEYFGLDSAGSDAGAVDGDGDGHQAAGKKRRKGLRGVTTVHAIARRKGVTHAGVGANIQLGLATLREDRRLQELASRHGIG
ncbi:MAG: sigma factor [Gemmataceae bacterium]